MTGTVIISIEVEFAWGHHDLPPEHRQKLSSHRTVETNALNRILRAADNYDIPITFPIVGHLLHTSCTADHHGPHPEGWFDVDPGSHVGNAPTFYAPDILNAIVESSDQHEIATHTYSHVLCDEISDDVLDWELETVSRLYEYAELPAPRSYVSPRHRSASYDVLKEHDITTLRVPFEGYTSPEGRLSTFRWILTRDHPVSPPRMVDGIMETYCTPHPSLTSNALAGGEEPPHPAFRTIPARIRQRRHQSYLRTAVDSAVEQNSSVHLWTHLYNTANEHQLQAIEQFMKMLAERRDNGEIDVVPMVDLGNNRYPRDGADK